MVTRFWNRTLIFLSFSCIVINATAQIEWQADIGFFNTVNLSDEGKTLVFNFTTVEILDEDGQIENSFDLPIPVLTDCIYSSYQNGVIEVMVFAKESNRYTIDLDGNLISTELISVLTACYRSVVKMSDEHYLLLGFEDQITLYSISEGIVRELNNLELCDFNENYFVTTQRTTNPTEALVVWWDLENLEIVNESIIPEANQIWLGDNDRLYVRIYDEQKLANKDQIKIYEALSGNLISEQEREYDSDISESSRLDLIQKFNQVSEECHYGIIVGDKSASFILGNPDEIMTITKFDHRFDIEAEKFDGDDFISINQSSDVTIHLFETVYRINDICSFGNNSMDNGEEAEENEEELEEDSTMTSDFQQIFPWITTDIIGGACDNLTISEYDFGGYSFVYFSDGRLFFEDGTPYCQKSEITDCVTIYGLTSDKLSNEWVCTSDDSIADKEGEEENNDNDFENSIDQVINQYPWLSNIDLSGSCEIEEYDLGSFSYLYVITGEQGILYYEDGRVFCRRSSSDCRALYNLSQSQITNTWSCDGSSDQEQDNEDSIISEDLFVDYTWLSVVIPSTCSSGMITEYISGVFTFLLIETPEFAELYFQDGTFYCNQSETFDCLAAYELTEIGKTFICSSGLVKPEIRSIFTEDLSFKLFPNPANEFVSIQLPSEINRIYIHAVNGQLIRQLAINGNDTQNVNISDLEQGVYYISISGGQSVRTKKLVKL